jgi:hypothetical protein
VTLSFCFVTLCVSQLKLHVVQSSLVINIHFISLVDLIFFFVCFYFWFLPFVHIISHSRIILRGAIALHAAFILILSFLLLIFGIAPYPLRRSYCAFILHIAAFLLLLLQYLCCLFCCYLASSHMFCCILLHLFVC